MLQKNNKIYFPIEKNDRIFTYQSPIIIGILSIV